MEYTKHSPGCYHQLLGYLSEKTGISLRKDIVTQQVYKINKRTGKKKLDYRAMDITVVDKDENRHPFIKDQKRYDLFGIVAAYFIVNVPRMIAEFGIEVNDAGNYRDSLGGGWYSNCPLFEIDGKYFASMECTCR